MADIVVYRLVNFMEGLFWQLLWGHERFMVTNLWRKTDTKYLSSTLALLPCRFSFSQLDFVGKEYYQLTTQR